ncbi:GDYXXLXY domain-containing protein [Undibacterium sp. Di24W]|uniref:GDYXXLXY domain-containing protein n=1 Tax=Undibacterium sp. Di24W TaxID=3413033 RepID=UPI003BF2C9FC
MWQRIMNLSVKTRTVLALAAGLLVLAAVNWIIVQREQLLTDGKLVLLELAPVDPRSLMQGDYMALRFKITNDAFPNSRWGLRSPLKGEAEPNYPRDGHLVVTLDEYGVGHFQRIARAGEVLTAAEVLLRYRIRNDQVKFATNGFFFEEGQAQAYEKARYGAFRVAANGDMILIAMYGQDYALLKNKSTDAASATE